MRTNFKLPRVIQKLRVDIAAVRAMAGRWDGVTGELGEALPPTGLGLAYQPSAAAVNAAHAAVARYERSLVARMHAGASHVAEADSRYGANEAHSVRELAAVRRA
jgi:hypothetical protein